MYNYLLRLLLLITMFREISSNCGIFSKNTPQNFTLFPQNMLCPRHRMLWQAMQLLLPLLSTVQILPKDQPRWFEQMESKDDALCSSSSINVNCKHLNFLCSLSQPQPPVGWSLTSVFSTNTSISQTNHSHQINRVNLVATCTLINYKITETDDGVQ